MKRWRPAEHAGPRRAIRGWDCEELLARVGRGGRLIVDANAEVTITGGSPVIIYRYGARTVVG